MTSRDRPNPLPGADVPQDSRAASEDAPKDIVPKDSRATSEDVPEDSSRAEPATSEAAPKDSRTATSGAAPKDSHTATSGAAPKDGLASSEDVPKDSRTAISEDVSKDSSPATSEAAPKDSRAPSENVPKDSSLATSEAAPEDSSLATDLPLWAADASMPAAAVADALTALSLALPPVRPAGDPRARLLAAATSPAHRFSPFVARLARLLDVADERAREMLADLACREVWQPLLPNIGLFHLEGGPAVAGADVGFCRIAAGTPFPYHRHLGDERVLVLQGGFVDDDGSITRAGSIAHRPVGTAHSITALPDQDLIYAVVIFGVEIPGVSRPEPG